MSKLNINKTEWLELVFEGKNKAYGAYQLRQENGATTTKAFFSGLALVAGLASLPMILSSFTDKPKETVVVISCPITPVNFQPNTNKPKSIDTKSEPKKAPKKNAAPLVVEANEVKPTEELPKNIETTNSTNGNSNENTSNTGTASNGTAPTTEVPKIDIPEIATLPMLEKNPMYPGGIEEFLKLVGKRFQAPEMEEASTVRIIVMFIVEKDGTLSNIKVPKSAGQELDEEAIRVLKSIKTKWEPGIYKGFPVRTQYSLPIVVRTN